MAEYRQYRAKSSREARRVEWQQVDGGSLAFEEVSESEGRGWGEEDAALVAMADELCADNVVGDETWNRLSKTWTEQQLLDLVVLAGFYRLVSGFLRTVGVQREPQTPGWPEGAS